MPNLKLIVLLITILTMAASDIVMPQKRAIQKRPSPMGLAAYRDNQCVICHLNLTEPVRVSAHFYEWFNSKHEEKNVGCEKCHGGDPAAKEKSAGHQGVLSSVFPQSRLHPRNLAETCGACHQEAVTAFVQSAHYQKLKETGDGPGCTTCHQHMATSVIYWPPETGKLCANCHQAVGNPAARYAQVPETATDVVAAFSRADEVIAWSYYLVSEGRKRRMPMTTEEEELKKLEQILKAAKLKWHEFDLKGSRQHADQVFVDATRVKNGLAAKGL